MTAIFGFVGSEMRPGNDPGEFEPSGKLSGGRFQVRTGGAHSRERAESEVKHGFVEWVEDWPCSSVRRDVRLGMCGLWGGVSPHRVSIFDRVVREVGRSVR